MSVPEAQVPTLATAATPSPPRRKRRRAPATGAANDCFTCSSQNIKCDRKRPYCTPCLSGEKDCAGYKTTLTWGVGVASRGKLRGLSLPIVATKPKQLAQPKTSPRKRDLVSSELPKTGLQELQRTSDSAQSLAPSSFPGTDGADSETVSITWQSGRSDLYNQPPAPQSSNTELPSCKAPSESTIQDEPLSSLSDDTLFPISTGLAETRSDQVFRSLAECFSPTAPSGYFRVFHSPQKERSLSWDDAMFGRRTDRDFSTPRGGCGESPSASESDDSNPDQTHYSRNLNGHGPLKPDRVAALRKQTNRQPGNTRYQKDGHDHLQRGKSNRVTPRTTYSRNPPDYDAPTIVPFPGGHAIGKTSRIQYLIRYYTEVITPVIVAFDGPTNPYRSYILRMAAESETLQHAISALSASNLRQRRNSGELSTGKTAPARRSSRAYLALTDKAGQSTPGFLTVEDQRVEESHHKNATVHLIQRQFADPSQHKDDSVLATLLIVCLFHICESGIAKFRTHFAGAKKLLGMRGNGSILQSKEAKWFTRMFTWFDAMTASVNDREGQMEDSLVDVSGLMDDEWTLENIAGCDGKLFRIIAKLGALNVLSQRDTLQTASAPPSCTVPMAPFHFSSYSTFGGDEWATSNCIPTSPPSNDIYPDPSTLYGHEWHGTRDALLSWALDTSPFGRSNPDVPALNEEQQVDLLNISESFRFSALIYLERLALPSVSSSDPRIQNWVQKALQHVQRVRSDVYLLWPLFVAGSECVSEGGRQIIRQRCLDIQKDSGFSNNASCLKLLEDIWATSSSESGNWPQPAGFRWRSAMQFDVADGEYIAV